jgi:hypothetical protein
MKKQIGLLIAVVCFAFPASARADNTACAGAVYVIPDGAVHPGTFTAAGQQRWFTFEAKLNRSYVITVENMSPQDFMATVGSGSPTTDCAGTLLTSTGAVVQSTWQSEPVNGLFSSGGMRWSVLTLADSTVNFTATGGVAGGTFQVRVEDTTQINTFFSTFSGFNTFYRLANTSNQPTLTVWIKMISDANTTLKFIQISIPANRSYATMNTTATGLLSIPANTAGFTLFCHDGPTGALALDGFLMQGTVVLPIKILDARQKR